MYFFVLSLLLVSSFGQIEGVIEDVEIKNNFGEAQFRILDGNKIKLPNRYRNSSSLKLSLNGAVIDKVQELSNGSTWTFSLSDKSMAEISVSEKDFLVEYYMIWRGGVPNEDREVCLHYGYNDASW